MRTYQVTIIGTQPLLMHNDDIEWADTMDDWKNNKDNKKGSKAGDDRSPAFRWLGSVYHDDQIVVIPAENIMRSMMEGGAMVPVPGGRSGKTFKAQSQSGITSPEPAWSLLVDGKTVSWPDIWKLKDEKDFKVHQATALQLGFKLFLKRAKIGASKHIRVRPWFQNWSTTGRLHVHDDQITTEALADILECAGTYKGLCDWRPGSKTPGSFGIFTSQVRLVKG